MLLMTDNVPGNNSEVLYFIFPFSATLYFFSTTFIW